MFETQKSGNKTSTVEIGLDIRTHASPKVGQDQVSRGVSDMTKRLLKQRKILKTTQPNSNDACGERHTWITVADHP